MVEMPNVRPRALYPRARLDALTDGIYAVAMTLLVLVIRLPDDFHPGNPAQLSQGLIDLWPKVFPYFLSFGVLGLRWLAAVRASTEAELLGGAYIVWWMLSLLLITCVPFTTIVVGRYASLAPAVWLYAGNIALLAVASWCQLKSLPKEEAIHHVRARQTSVLLLLASAVACIVCSLFAPSHALWAFMLNAVGPALARRSEASA
jgi:uncharacterized membrane protein